MKAVTLRKKARIEKRVWHRLWSKEEGYKKVAKGKKRGIQSFSLWKANKQKAKKIKEDQTKASFWKANKQKTKENQGRPNQGFFLEGKQNDQLPKETK